MSFFSIIKVNARGTKRNEYTQPLERNISIEKFSWTKKKYSRVKYILGSQ